MTRTETTSAQALRKCSNPGIGKCPVINQILTFGCAAPRARSVGRFGTGREVPGSSQGRRMRFSPTRKHWRMRRCLAREIPTSCPDFTSSPPQIGTPSTLISRRPTCRATQPWVTTISSQPIWRFSYLANDCGAAPVPVPGSLMKRMRMRSKIKALGGPPPHHHRSITPWT